MPNLLTAALTWSRSQLTYLANGKPLERKLIKAGAEAVVVESRARINAASLTLQQAAQKGKLNEAAVLEWMNGMRHTAKLNYMANAALARGGWDNMAPRDWERVSQKLVALYEGSDGKHRSFEQFGNAILNGYYGKDLSSGNFLLHASMVADGGRAVYEGEYLNVQREAGREECRRVLAAVDHCPDCIEWADLDWMPLDEMESNYAIGDSVCGARCHCVLIYR